VTPYGVIPFEFHHALWHQKTRVPGYCVAYLPGPMFSHFDTILECDGQTNRHTHRQTHDNGIYLTSIASCSKNTTL